MSNEIKESAWKEKLKSKGFIGLLIGSIVMVVAFYTIGSSTAKGKIDDQSVNYNEIVELISEKESELEEKETDIEELETEIEAKKAEFKEVEANLSDKNKEYEAALTIIKEKESNQDKIEELENEIGSKQDEIKDLNGQIDDKESELASITGEVKKAEGEPKTLSAGFFTVGVDLPEGRYLVTPNDNGNFFVNEGMSVNIMIGNGDFYESEYVFTANEGDSIELTTSATFTPVE